MEDDPRAWYRHTALYKGRDVRLMKAATGFAMLSAAALLMCMAYASGRFLFSRQVEQFHLAVFPGLTEAQVRSRVGPPAAELLPGDENRLRAGSYIPNPVLRIRHTALVYYRLSYRFVVYIGADGRVACVVTGRT